ncbi:7,8-dihydropterin-6-methyl-4-(beta-D-ribofuranosyl)-aminobenzene-5'-phosphate synthase [Penicillium chrysogenum]|uniref:7, 8-dihydropterin-6-methyl-4-(Beta-D-ribofuranosyl)-aminobenzene-5'-phosphate synthase n=1 Tax=Penicillium chrysogenum TaxID=5076 RepID=A0A167YRE3_PENCH|nr:7,8-dihydropterin-6-methyl-4-(beta-D-ribofuranosyl)-aminobenzene-5'-phosphate synthase [Penicillium chrysogenum]
MDLDTRHDPFSDDSVEMPINLEEVDSLEAIVIIDNELDPLSPPAPDTVQVSGNLGAIAMGSKHTLTDRGDACKELRLEDVCCAAHGLSILVTATKSGKKHTILFDAGPEEEAWERNVKRLRPNLSSVEVIHLSHWHRDHSGGLLRAIRMISDAKRAESRSGDLVADLHPDRPVYRGISLPSHIISLQADPTFEEIGNAGAVVDKRSEPHTVLDNFFLVSGEIPRVTPYETGLKNAVRYDPDESDWFSDEVIVDERSLIWKGLVVFTGCSHAGVVNTTKHAVELTGGTVPVHAVVGGFHLATSDADQIQDTVADLKGLDPAVLMPGHCSGWRAKFAIEKHMPGSLVPCTVGSRITF